MECGSRDATRQSAEVEGKSKKGQAGAFEKQKQDQAGGGFELDAVRRLGQRLCHVDRIPRERSAMERRRRHNVPQKPT